MHLEVLMELHQGLLQQGPGSDVETRRALECIPPLDSDARILDVGCGPGRQTLVLARETEAAIDAIDLMPTFLEELEQRVRTAGYADRVSAHLMSMSALDFPERVFDLIWSEGAIYQMGFARGLESWKRHLVPGGYLAVTELCWLSNERPVAAAEFWGAAYPAMTQVETNIATAERAGYECLNSFSLPESAWWNDYYDPIRARLPALFDKYTGDDEALNQLRESAEEIDLFERYSQQFNYVFYVFRLRRRVEAED